MTGNRSSLFVASCFVLAGLSGCQTHPKASSPARVNDQTVVPTEFPGSVAPPDKIIVPADMLKLAEVQRQSAEVREGPGTEFALSEQLLKQGDQVVVFEKIGNWQKIMSTYGKIEGWVHYRALGELQNNDKLVELNLIRLPKVFAAHEISQAWDEPNQQEIVVKIPKGSNFAALKFEESKTLVYLAESNSPIWLSRKDAQ